MSKQPTIDRKDLVRVLTEASIFACRGADIPLLNSVRLQATGERLLAVATDRFMLGVSSAEYQGRPFTITLPMPEVKLILGACKLKANVWKPKDVVDLRVTPKRTLLHVTLDETVITVPTFKEDYPYPDWRKLLGSSVDDVEQVEGTLGLNPQYLAKFGKIGSRAKFYMRGPSKPVMVRIGEDFIGLIMPIYLKGDAGVKTWELPEWLGAPSDQPAEVAS